MDKRKQASYSILMYLAAYVGGSIIFQGLVAYIFSVIYKLNVVDLITLPTDADAFLINKYYLVMTISNFLVYALAFGLLIYNNRDKLKTKFKLYHLGIIILGSVVLYGASYLINYWLSSMDIGSSNNQQSIELMVAASPVLNFVTLVLLAPFVEEVVFRVAIRDLTSNRYLYYLVSILAFSLPHMLSTAARIDIWLLQLIPYLISGLILAFVYDFTRNLYVNYTIHLLNNLIAFIITLVTMGVILC